MNSKIDWTFRKVSDLAEIEPGGTPSTAVSEYWNGENLWATPTDITASNGKYISGTTRMISNSGLKHVSKVLPVGSILLCTRATIGDARINTVPITTNQGFKNLVPRSKVCNEWLYYILQTKIEEMKSLSSGSTFLELGTKQLGNIEISTPPYDEQKAIARALSDIDELIENLRIEILKLQLVLEAQKDFYFSKENTKNWQVFKIGEIGVLSTATRKQSNFEPSSDFVILDMGSVSDKGLILETKYTREHTDLLSVGDLVIPKDDIGGGNIIGKAVHVPIANRYVLGDHVFKLSVNRNYFNPEFTRYILNSKESNKRVISLVAGSAQLGLPKSSFLTHQLSFPDLETQNKICEKLNSTEVLLYSSKQNLAKYECIKQGMAHDLLTGKVRLV